MTNNNVKMIAAVAAAVVTGTVLGLIFAPAKGEDTRNKLARGAKGIADNMKKKILNETAEIIN